MTPVKDLATASTCPDAGSAALLGAFFVLLTMVSYKDCSPQSQPPPRIRLRSGAIFLTFQNLEIWGIAALTSFLLSLFTLSGLTHSSPLLPHETRLLPNQTCTEKQNTIFSSLEAHSIVLSDTYKASASNTLNSKGK